MEFVFINTRAEGFEIKNLNIILDYKIEIKFVYISNKFQLITSPLVHIVKSITLVYVTFSKLLQCVNNDKFLTNFKMFNVNF